MTARPPPSGQQGPIRLYVALAPGMDAGDIGGFMQSQAFRESGAGLYLAESELIRIGVDDLARVLEGLPTDDAHQTFPAVLHFRGAGEDERETALAALMHAVSALKPDALAIEPPAWAVDRDATFMPELRARLETFTGPTPHLYRAGADRHAFIIPAQQDEPVRVLYRRFKHPSDIRDRQQSFRADVASIFGEPPRKPKGTVIDGMVVRLEGNHGDRIFLAECRKHLDQLKIA